MSSSAELDKALRALKDAGHEVGAPHVTGAGEVRIPIDHTARTYEEIYQMAANLQPHEAERTGEYVRMVAAPNTRMGRLGLARVELGRLEYLFHHDTRFDDVCRHFTFAKLTLSRVTARRTTS